MDATVWAKYYGRRHLGSIRGVTMIGSLGGTALGPYPVGVSMDRLGSFAPALLVLVALLLGISVVALFIQRPVKQS